jgi:hypothetical protein
MSVYFSSVIKFFTSSSRKTYKHPFKVNPSWGLTPELRRLDKIPLINSGTNSYAASDLIHANRPSDIVSDPSCLFYTLI